MTNFRNGVAVLASALFTLLLANNVSAFTVWAVDGGADPSSNAAGGILIVEPGLHRIDLYFDTELDKSAGWDISLDVDGSGFIFDVSGGDINGGFGLANGSGHQQLGGNEAVEVEGSSLLLFSFQYDTEDGDMLFLLGTSKYTSGLSFETVSIAGATLVTTSTVPVPASLWLLLSGLGVIAGAKRKIN